jgi:hypothetical protein
MNLLGYYESEEIWIPDPFAEQQNFAKQLNTYKTKYEKEKFLGKYIETS